MTKKKKPSNPVAKELRTGGKFKHQVIPDKKKDYFTRSKAEIKRIYMEEIGLTKEEYDDISTVERDFCYRCDTYVVLDGAGHCEVCK